MKTLCPKPGKIHPSPPGGGADPTAAALRVLPAAIFALAAALRPEDQQVLAYLVTRSLQGAAAPHPEQPPFRGRRRRAHPPAIGCGCFDCYTSFWSRWDCSPNREAIHDAIDAFEDHLAAAESSSSSAASTPSPSKRRDKGKRKAPPTPLSPPRMSPKSEEPQAEKVQEPSPVPASPPAPPSPPAPAASAVESDREKKVPEDSSEAETVENAEVEGEEERKRGWADVMGMLNLRLWGIWSPAVESAT